MVVNPSPVTALPAPAPDAERLLAELLALQREVHEQAHLRRADGLERAGEAVRRLGELGSAEGILERAASELAGVGDFDWVVLSELEDGRLTALAGLRRGNEQGLEGLPAEPITLAYPLAEVEVARDRSARLVDTLAGRGRLPRGWAGILGERPYAVAALTAQAETVGLVHAGTSEGGRTLDSVDAELTGRFAEALSGVLERAVLRHTLALHRAELESAVRWLSGRLSWLDDSFETGAAAAAEGESRLAQSLTPRELEVLTLLARGQTNRAIAEALVVREGTVKYHVKNILRKLGASSRADAVARFVRSASAASER